MANAYLLTSLPAHLLGQCLPIKVGRYWITICRRGQVCDHGVNALAGAPGPNTNPLFIFSGSPFPATRTQLY